MPEDVKSCIPPDVLLRALDLSPDAIYLIDEQGRVEYANATVAKMLGYSDAELMGMTSMGLCHPDDRGRVADIVGQAVSEEHWTQTVTHRYRSKTGRIFWGRITVQDIRDTFGQLRRFCFVEDIDEERQVHEELKRSEERFRAISESAYEGLITSDGDGMILYWNGGAESIFGYQADEVIGRPLSCLMPERFQAAHDNSLRRWAETGASPLPDKPVELVAVRKSGEEFPVEIAFATWESDSGRFITGAIRDTSDRVRWERILDGIVEGTASQIGERFFESLVAHLVSALDARYAFVTEALDQPLTQVRTLVFLDRDEILENREFMVSGTPCESVTAGNGNPCCYPRDVAKKFPLATELAPMEVESFLGAPLINSRGEVIGHLVVMDDHPMTEDENRLKTVIRIFAARAAAELERVLGDRRIEYLLKSNQALLRRSIAVQEEERRRLRRELHDEMGQSLTGIQAYAATISNLSAGDSESPSYQAAESIRTITSGVFGAMRRIMNQLRPALLDELGLQASLKAMLEDWNKQHDGIRAELNAAGDLSVFSESINITVYRLIQECLTNVARHAGATSVAISLQHVIDSDGDRLLITVSDNGKGLREERSSGGIGIIGMSERVRAVGGAIDLGTRDEGGAVIHIWLPAGD